MIFMCFVDCLRNPSMPDTKLYDILGVPRNASDQEIKKVGKYNLDLF